MGSIEYVGIINDIFNTLSDLNISTEIPENAHFIDEYNWVDMLDPLNQFIVAIPIFVIILIIAIFKQRKNGVLNKEIQKEYIEENNITGTLKTFLNAMKYLLIMAFIIVVRPLLIAPIHELLHCIAGALAGLNMKFGFDPQSCIAFAYTEDKITKIQYLITLLTPLIILGIIPLIVLFITYPKGKMSFKKAFKYLTLTFLIVAIIISSTPDIIQSFNLIRYVPNNAIVEDDYWYYPDEE